jgi:hypothetical protein
MPGLDAVSWYQDGMSRCQDCGADLDHCHGTLVVHGDGTSDCTDAACGGADPMRHSLIIDCLAVLGGGCCVKQDAQDFATAS